MKQHNRRLDIILALAFAAFAVLPWYRIEDGFLSFGWLAGMFGDGATAPGLWQIAFFGRPWLGAVAVFMLLCAGARFLLPVERRSGVLIWASLLGVLFLALQGLAIGFSGWNWMISENLFGALSDGQPAFGAGAILTGFCFLLIFSFGLAERGVMKGTHSSSLPLPCLSPWLLYSSSILLSACLPDRCRTSMAHSSLRVSLATFRIPRSGVWPALLVRGDVVSRGAHCGWR